MTDSLKCMYGKEKKEQGITRVKRGYSVCRTAEYEIRTLGGVRGALHSKFTLGGAVYSMCAVSCESNVTKIKMEEDPAMRIF